MEYSQNNQQNTFSITELFFQYKKYWHWFLTSILLCLLIASAFIFTSKPQYEADASLLIRTEKSANLYSQLTLVEGVGYTLLNKIVDDEISVLSSRALIFEVIEALDLEISYFEKEKMLGGGYIELYKDSPIELEMPAFREKDNTSFNIIVRKTNKGYKVHVRKGGHSDNFLVENFNQPLQTFVGEIKLTEKTPLALHAIYKITYTSKDLLSTSIIKKLKLTDQGRRGNVVDLSIKTGAPEKSKDILNKLLEFYTLDGIEEKNEIAIQTILDIDSRIDEVNLELLRIEKEIESLKSQNRTNDREQKLQELNRLKEAKENNFLFLMEKKEENELFLKSDVPASKIINFAQAKYKADSLPSSLLILVALLVGVSIPMILIYGLGLLSHKVLYRNDFVKMLSVPLLGFVKKVRHNKFYAVNFQNLRANLQYNLAGKKPAVIQINSAVDKEGKSTVGLNLAYSFASIGKKTVIVNLNSKGSDFSQSFNFSASQSLVQYLLDGNLKLRDILLQSSDNENLYYIDGGDFGFNGPEIILSSKLDEVIEKLKEEFEYILVISSPVNKVTDAFQLNRFADANIFVVRQYFTTYDALSTVNQIYEDNKLKNMTVIVNGVN